jgi:hypothetical protein
MRIDNFFICDRSSLVKSDGRMSPPFANRSPRFVKHGLGPRFTNLSSRFVKHGLSPRFPSPVQSVFYKFSPRFVKHGLSPRFPVQSSPVQSVFYNMPCKTWTESVFYKSQSAICRRRTHSIPSLPTILMTKFNVFTEKVQSL